MSHTHHKQSITRLLLLRLSIKPNTPIVNRESIPTPARKACLYIFSLASASLSCKYFTRYCVICAIFNAVDVLSFIRFIVSLFIFIQTTFLPPLHSGLYSAIYHAWSTWYCWKKNPTSDICCLKRIQSHRIL